MTVLRTQASHRHTQANCLCHGEDSSVRPTNYHSASIAPSSSGCLSQQSSHHPDHHMPNCGQRSYRGLCILFKHHCQHYSTYQQGALLEHLITTAESPHPHFLSRTGTSSPTPSSGRATPTYSRYGSPTVDHSTIIYLVKIHPQKAPKTASTHLCLHTAYNLTINQTAR